MRNITVEKDGQKINLVIKKPTRRDLNKAQSIYNKAFSDAVADGMILAAQLNEYLIEKGIWNEKQEAKYKELLGIISNNDIILKKGGITLEEAKKHALAMREAREELKDLLVSRRQYESNCVEGIAQNMQFDFLVSACVFKEDGSPLWNSVDSYYEDADTKLGSDCAGAVAELIYGLDDDFEKNLPENQFLMKYKFVDEDLHFINKLGQKVDSEGRLIDDEGRYINYDADGNVIYVNIHGEEVDENGELKVQFKPFLDEDGNPVE